MCGIVGQAGDLNTSHKSVFKDMLTVCQLRGRDATGVVAVDGGGSYQLVKRVGVPEFLLETKAYDKAVDTGVKKVLIGHCRAKTFGGNTNANAHPFEHNGLCGVHNGTLSMYYGMEGAKDFDVDSDWLYWHMSIHGVKETIEQLDADGAWALVWWDENDKTLNFLRNKHRSLYYAHSLNQKVLYWASEPWMFAVIERRARSATDEWNLFTDEQGKKIHAVPEDTWLKFDVASSGAKPSDIFKMHTPVEVKGEVRGQAGNHGWRGSSASGYSPAHLHRRTPNNTGPSVNGGEVVVPFVMGESPKPMGVKPEIDPLNDTLLDLDGGCPVHLLPKPVVTPTREGLPITHIGGKRLPTSSSSPSGSSTALTPSSITPRPRLSLPSPTSNNARQESKGSTSSTSSGCTTNLKKHQHPVSFRQISGIWYVTDNKTGREFSEHEFEDRTTACCTFCTKPIGDLKEVYEIFHRDKGTFSEVVSFIGTCCINPYKVN